MAGRDSAKYSRNVKARRCGAAVGGALGAFVAAAAMATGSAAPAKADFEDLLEPIIQPLLTSVTDSFSGLDPTVGVDLTSWTDSLLTSLNSIDLALPSAAEPATASAAAASPASITDISGDSYIPLTMQETTEPTVNASIDGSSPETLLVDTGSSGLVIPYTDLGLANLLELGLPSSFGESGYSGGVDYIYLTYDNVPVDYDTVDPSTGTDSTLDTTTPVEVEIYSWDPSDPTSFFTNDAFQNFLASDDSPGGILGIGDDVSGGAGESPIEGAGFTGATVDEPDGYLIASDGNPGTAYDTLPSTGSTPTGDLTETVSSEADGQGTVYGTDPVSDDIDSGGVYGTIPSSIESDSDGVPDGDWVTVTDPNTGDVLYSYQVENAGGDQLPDETPTEVSGSSIDSGYEAFQQNPVYIDYTNDDVDYDNPLT
jgi:hypothetical protein